MSQPLYIFDLDETLINADSSMLWHRFLVEKRIVTDDNFLAEDKRLMSLYSAGKLNMPEYLNFTMAPLAQLTKEQVDSLVDECVEKMNKICVITIKDKIKIVGCEIEWDENKIVMLKCPYHNSRSLVKLIQML